MDKELQKLVQSALDKGPSTGVEAELKQIQELLLKRQNTENICATGILSKFRLDGQVALVTGSGQGIGRSLAHALGEAGCSVVVADINLTTATSVAAELGAKGIPNLAVKVDISQKSDVSDMMRSTLEKFGQLHIACNNAAIASQSDAEFTEEAEWDSIFGVDLKGTFHCCQVEGKHMLEKGYGRIINTASIIGSIVTRPNRQSVYNTSKAGVIHMTKSLAAEWAGRGVTVNCISPGYVDTDLIRTEKYLGFRTQWIKDTPMGRLGDVEEMTGAVIYLASGLSSYTTGLDIIIDGGYTLW